MFIRRLCGLLWLLLHFACNTDANFEEDTSICVNALEANASFVDVKNLYQGELLQIQEDWIIEGYVISSDGKGNFFSVLHFQDLPQDPTAGFQLALDVRDNHLWYPPGSKIYVKLKGLYLGQRSGVFELGGTFAAFGTTSVGRLPASIAQEHLFVSCNTPISIKPVTIDGIPTAIGLTNTLVQLNGLEISETELDLPFAEPQEATERTLQDCEANTITLLNSGFSDFHSVPLPVGNGSVTGVLSHDNGALTLTIRSLEDLKFDGQRCLESMPEVTSNNILISELADPNNNADARFVELYNTGSQEVNLSGWTLVRYNNANTASSSSVDLSGNSMGANETLVIAADAIVFEEVYGFPPDLEAGSNSPADSNGDDNLQLLDPFGVLIDSFGVVGEDGSGTDHEFEDGRASRLLTVLQANPVYSAEEWVLFNDTGNLGTINMPQNAPQDFTPGIRE